MTRHFIAVKKFFWSEKFLMKWCAQCLLLRLLFHPYLNEPLTKVKKKPDTVKNFLWQSFRLQKTWMAFSGTVFFTPASALSVAYKTITFSEKVVWKDLKICGNSQFTTSMEKTSKIFFLVWHCMHLFCH